MLISLIIICLLPVTYDDCMIQMQGGVVLTQNLPIEIHASKIYTRTMFEKFGEMLYEGGLYMLVKVVPRREYTTRYVKMDSREKWCKNDFVVQVNDLGDEFKCECGIFEHFGMVCSHALKVSPLFCFNSCAREIIIYSLRYKKSVAALN